MILDVGDVIYTTERFGNRLFRFTVSRVTEKQAIVETRSGSNVRFDRDVGYGGHFYPKGAWSGGKWSAPSSYSIETPELRSRYNRQRLEEKFNNIKASELTNEQLADIIRIAKTNGTTP